MAAVLVPIYKNDLSKSELISLQQCKKIFSRHPIILIAPETMHIENNELSGLTVERFPEYFFKGIDGYNQLMLSKEYYQRFELYKYILIYQLDAFVFCDQLQDFCKLGYDYIGAPWLRGERFVDDTEIRYLFVGNGGFSLRRIDSFLTILENEDVSGISCPEDVFWSSRKKLNIAPVEVAVSFSFEEQVKKSFELNHNKLPFGCHAWFNFDFDFFRPYMQEEGYDLSDIDFNELDKERSGFKIVLFGTGMIFEKIRTQIDFNKVVGFIDNDEVKRCQRINGLIVLQPERINEMCFDYVVICNKRAYSQMREQLISLGVDSSKIIGWRYYLYRLEFKTDFLSRMDYEKIRRSMEQLNIISILDIDRGVEKNAFYTGDTKLAEREKNIRIYSEEDTFNPNVYDGSEKDVEKVDIALFLDYFQNHSVEDFYVKIQSIAHKTQYVMVSVPYEGSDEWMEWVEADFRRLGEILVIAGKAIQQVIIKLIPESHGGDELMYVVSHKAFQIPRDPFYKPLYVGGYEPSDKDALKDSLRENIATLNEKINELTAVYWIWKNTHSVNVGLCHYRRYFGRCLETTNPYFGLMTPEQAKNCLNDADIVVAKTICLYPMCVSEQLKDTINRNAYELCYELYVGRIKEICPEYLETFYFVMDAIVIYPCNMFYTSWDIFDRYCSWLFPIVIDVAEKMDVSGYDSYSKRVVGFFAERMLTVWILHNHMKVAETEVIFISD